jgi:hypothetical protein
MEISDLIKIWDNPEGHPYKGKLIDLRAYNKNPDSISCFCAQGQVLHLLGGVEPEALAGFGQVKADREVAALLGISVAHSVLLRWINDGVDGAPAVVITNPAAVLGDQADTVLAFWRYLDRMTAEQRDAARDAAGDAAGDAASAAAWAAAGAAAGDAASAAAGASNEIQGAAVMRGRGQPFFFLPLFGFADPEVVLAAEIAA